MAARAWYKHWSVSLAVGAYHLASLSCAAQAATPAINTVGWEVTADGGQCVAISTFANDGSTIYLGITTGFENGDRISIASADWSIEPGKWYDVDYNFGKWGYTIPSIGFDAPGGKGLQTLASDAFLADFAAASTLELKVGDKPFALLSLQGSARALADLKSCEKDASTTPAISRDPFKSTEGRAAP